MHNKVKSCPNFESVKKKKKKVYIFKRRVAHFASLVCNKRRDKVNLFKSIVC